MQTRHVYPRFRQLLEARSEELPRAGGVVSPQALAQTLIEARGLQRDLALQLATDYLAGKARPTPEALAARRRTRRRRTGVAALALGAIAAVVWFFGDTGGWQPPPWFVALILGLAGMNLLVWVLEPVASVGIVDCARCGAPRRVEVRKGCPVCGTEACQLPLVGRVALWVVALFFTCWGAFFFIAGLLEPTDRARHFLESIGWLVVSAAVVLRALGFRVDRLFRRFVDLKIDDDFDRMARRPYMAVQVLLLIASLVGFALAIVALLRA